MSEPEVDEDGVTRRPTLAYTRDRDGKITRIWSEDPARAALVLMLEPDPDKRA